MSLMERKKVERIVYFLITNFHMGTIHLEVTQVHTYTYAGTQITDNDKMSSLELFVHVTEKNPTTNVTCNMLLCNGLVDKHEKKRLNWSRNSSHSRLIGCRQLSA